MCTRIMTVLDFYITRVSLQEVIIKQSHNPSQVHNLISTIFKVLLFHGVDKNHEKESIAF
jgi:hypothetical protein